MGRGMALNLLKAGNKMVMWNRSVGKLDEFRENESVTIATSPMEVVASCDITYSMLSTPAVAKEVFFSDEGTLAGVSEGKRIVDCATLDGATMQEFETAIKGKGGIFLEAPVSGSKGPAEQGTLIMICAGNKNLYDEIAETDLTKVGKASFYLGEVGQGSRMKIAVNMVMGQMMVAMAEGVSLTEASQLDPAAFVEILGLGAMACGMFKGKGPNMLKDSYPTQFPLKHQAKDVHLAMELGKEVGQPLPQCCATDQTFKAAVDKGHGDEDFSAVVAAVRRAPPS